MFVLGKQRALLDRLPEADRAVYEKQFMRTNLCAVVGMSFFLLATVGLAVAAGLVKSSAPGLSGRLTKGALGMVGGAFFVALAADMVNGQVEAKITKEIH